MTSKHLFFKAMREDLRHKAWMIALSVLANFLLLPVAWLVAQNNARINTSSEFIDAKYYWFSLLEYLQKYVSIAGGVIAIVGALIVGLCGFRYVFHRNMIDTYHSIPIKRGTLYGVYWLDGFLIWLLPFLACLLATYFMVFGYAAPLFNEELTPWMLFQTAGVTLLVLTVVFLLVYHLILTAVMLSGNVLNTLVSLVILGFGAISIYGIALVFFSHHMTTFYAGNIQDEWVYYLSPGTSAIYLLYQRIHSEYFGMTDLWMQTLINAGAAALLGIASWLLYKRRASELAEQGIRNKVLSAALRIVVSMAVGMGGWLIFIWLFDSRSAVGWGIFGALLAGIVVFGTLDIIFSMDFKAFFSHKIQMALSMAFSLLICFSMYGDWYGFDAYLPDKEEIAEIAIVDSNYTNRRRYYTYGDDNDWLNRISIKDVDAAYAYLQVMAGRERGEYIDQEVHDSKRIKTKVTLKSGKVYYRVYTVTDVDLDLVWPLYSNYGYLETNYLLDGEMLPLFDQIRFQREDMNNQLIEISSEKMAALAEAYNKDVLEHTEAMLLRQGNLLTRLELQNTSGYPFPYNEDGGLLIYSLTLDIFDSMTNTIEALEHLGFGEWISQKGARDIREIRLPLYGRYDDYDTVTDVIEDARSFYGVPAEGDNGEDDANMVYVMSYLEDGYPVAASQKPLSRNNELTVRITDEEEIEELLTIISYTDPYTMDTVFCPRYLSIAAIDSEGTEYNYYIKKGGLPEKYIFRFGQLYEYLKQQ